MSDPVEQLRELYKEKASNGLVDVKFDFYDSVKDASLEEICQEILNIEEAISHGNYTKLDFGDLSLNRVEE